MGERTAIEWCDATMNFWVGCSKVSAGCDHCYAETYSERYRANALGTEWGAHGTRHRTSPANWKKPYKWEREAIAQGKPIKVFCSSLGDIFDNHPSIQPEWREAMWQTIRDTPHLIWQLLTKRPQLIDKYLPDDLADAKNIWMGITAENQKELDRRLPKLVKSKWKGLRYLSCEPLLSELELTTWFYRGAGISWLICGGESGNGFRPMKEDWVRSIQQQCANAGVAFFYKQPAGRFPGGEALLDGKEYKEFPNEN